MASGCKTWFEAAHEARVPIGSEGWHLCLQWGRLHHEEDGARWVEEGYRFVYRDDKSNQKPFRAQTRIPSLKKVLELINQAKREGWGDFDTGE